MTLEAPPMEGDNAGMLDDKIFEFSAREMTFGDRNAKQMTDQESGVLIDKAESGGWAELAGIHGGDVLLSVDGQPTSSISQLKACLAKVEKEKPRRIVCFVRRGIHTEYLEIEPDWR